MYKKNESDLLRNIRVHNKLAKKYERMHGEIYNDFEQSRLRNELSEAISTIKTISQKKIAIDFGCGAGNLTRHLSNLGCDVIASDVSQGFLDLVASRSYDTNVSTIRLNGLDLKNIPNDCVDMVATYSVLHHLPDYISIFSEFMRVLKPGGVVYIDHELSEDFWSKSAAYLEFELKMKNKSKLNLRKYLIPKNYYDWLIRLFINPRYHREGDIHVFKDDHIEWNKISSNLIALGGEVVYQKKYLLFRRNYDSLIFEAYKEKINDMHLLVARKIYN